MQTEHHYWVCTLLCWHHVWLWCDPCAAACQSRSKTDWLCHIVQGINRTAHHTAERCVRVIAVLFYWSLSFDWLCRCMYLSLFDPKLRRRLRLRTNVSPVWIRRITKPAIPTIYAEIKTTFTTVFMPNPFTVETNFTPIGKQLQVALPQGLRYWWRVGSMWLAIAGWGRRHAVGPMVE